MKVPPEAVAERFQIFIAIAMTRGNDTYGHTEKFPQSGIT